MALIFTDNMLSYGSTDDLTKRWGSNPSSLATYHATEGPDGDGVIKLPNTTSALLTADGLATPAGTVIGGMMRFKQAALQSGSTQHVIILGARNSISGAVTWALGFVSATGRVGCGLVGGPAAVTYQGSTNVCDNVWHRLEWQVDAKDSGGSIKVWVDGVLEINQTGIDSFSGTAHATLPWTGGVQLQGASQIRHIKDLAVFDSAGPAGGLRTQEQPYGTLKFKTLRPTGAGASTQFIPNTGANYAAVDEQGQDGSATYVESNTSSHRDLYGMSDLPETPVAVYAMSQHSYWINGGDDVIPGRQVLRSGVTDDLGPTVLVNFIGDFTSRVIDLDPATGTAWTEATVNAVQSGFEVP